MGGTKERLMFVKDDSCHWYVIPASKREQFVAWEDSFNDEESMEEYEGESFDDCRLSMHVSNYTFTDLQEVS